MKISYWTASKTSKKPKQQRSLASHFLLYIFAVTAWLRREFFYLKRFFKNANKQNMRARANGATREEKRVALVTFLVSGDFTRSLKIGTTRLLQYTVASHADVRSLITHSSRSWGRNAGRNPRTKNVRVGSYSLSKYVKGSCKWNLDSFRIKISPIQTFFHNFFK